MENVRRVMEVSVVVSDPAGWVCAVALDNFGGKGVANMAGDVIIDETAILHERILKI